jgi:hypothetical protein
MTSTPPVTANPFLVDDLGHPNLSSEFLKARELPLIALNVKFFGYELARRLAAELPAVAHEPPGRISLTCKAATQADLSSSWAAWWCSQLKVPRVFHRKIWEFVYVLQVLEERGALRPDATGLGFGCGKEPLASYFVSRGINTLVTDLAPERSQELGWIDSGQHTSSLETAFHSHLATRADFERLARHRFVDMNNIPDDLLNFDFCWSICSLEHLGSIEKGLSFIARSIDTLKPGGVAVHTTEFNFAEERMTVDNWPTVLFQRRHFIEISERLKAAGHDVAPLDFDVGAGPLDRFIDVPPYLHDWTPEMIRQWGADANHIKLSVDGFASTCFGLIIQKAPAP